MSAAMVLAGVFGVFIPALLLPGPDFIAVVRSSMTRGTAAGLLTALGVSCGLGLYATLSLLGLSVVLAQYQWLAWAIRICGGAYLIYLGVRLWTAPPARLDLSQAEATPPGRALVFGFLVTLTNPKAIVLFASVFATAATAQTPGWLMTVMIGLVFAASLGWYAAVALFMSSAPVMRRFRHARQRIERMAGLCFVLIGGRIVASAPTA